MINRIIPAYLQKGDKIGIVAPARKISPEEIQPAIEILKNRGWQVVFGKNLFKADRQFSGTDAERAADLQEMLDDNSVKAIFCARGGHGTVRIIERLDFSAFRISPKWIVGFSDATVLHAHIHANMRIETLHAPLLLTLPQSAAAAETLFKTLSGDAPQYQFPPDARNRNGVAEGAMVDIWRR